MGALDGRRLRFTRVDDAAVGGRGSYEVAAITTGHVGPEPLWVLLGYVTPAFRSTDSKIAGTRLRRSGKGARVWEAIVPLADRPRPQLRYLQHQFDGTWRLEPWHGQRWDRRADAAAALVTWHDHPELRALRA